MLLATRAATGAQQGADCPANIWPASSCNTSRRANPRACEATGPETRLPAPQRSRRRRRCRRRPAALFHLDGNALPLQHRRQPQRNRRLLQVRRSTPSRDLRPCRMGSNEEIASFKRNLRAIIGGLTNGAHERLRAPRRCARAAARAADTFTPSAGPRPRSRPHIHTPGLRGPPTRARSSHERGVH